MVCDCIASRRACCKSEGCFWCGYCLTLKGQCAARKHGLLVLACINVAALILCKFTTAYGTATSAAATACNARVFVHPAQQELTRWLALPLPSNQCTGNHCSTTTLAPPSPFPYTLNLLLHLDPQAPAPWPPPAPRATVTSTAWRSGSPFPASSW